MVGEWLGVAGGSRRTETYWWSGGLAAISQARPDAAKRHVIAESATKAPRLERPPAVTVNNRPRVAERAVSSAPRCRPDAERAGRGPLDCGSRSP